jgi:hypothetical protein
MFAIRGTNENTNYFVNDDNPGSEFRDSETQGRRD